MTSDKGSAYIRGHAWSRVYSVRVCHAEHRKHYVDAEEEDCKEGLALKVIICVINYVERNAAGSTLKAQGRYERTANYVPLKALIVGRERTPHRQYDVQTEVEVES